MCACIYLYTYTHMRQAGALRNGAGHIEGCINLYAYTYMAIHVRVYVYKYTHVCILQIYGMYSSVRVHTYVCTYICMYTHMWFSGALRNVAVAEYKYKQKDIYMCGYMVQIHVYVYIHMYIHTHVVPWCCAKCGCGWIKIHT